MIYFVYDRQNTTVKIGYTENIGRRLYQLKRSHGSHLVLINILSGNRQSEKIAHEKFKGLRLTGEWFTFSDDMLHIRSHELVPNADTPKKFYFAAIEVPESVYKFFSDKAEKEKRTISGQIRWELEQLSNAK